MTPDAPFKGVDDGDEFVGSLSVAAQIGRTAVSVCVSGVFGFALDVVGNAVLAKPLATGWNPLLLTGEIAWDVAPAAIVYTICGLIVLPPLRHVMLRLGLDHVTTYVLVFPLLVLVPDVVLLVVGLGVDSSVTIGKCIATVRGIPTACGLASLAQTFFFKAAVAAASGLIFAIVAKGWNHRRVDARF